MRVGQSVTRFVTKKILSVLFPSKINSRGEFFIYQGGIQGGRDNGDTYPISGNTRRNNEPLEENERVVVGCTGWLSARRSSPSCKSRASKMLLPPSLPFSLFLERETIRATRVSGWVT